jgi:hypothetical protein
MGKVGADRNLIHDGHGIATEDVPWGDSSVVEVSVEQAKELGALCQRIASESAELFKR